MAIRTVTFVDDDLDGSPGAQTVSFSWAGTSYEIDLSEKNAAELEATLTKYIEVARRAAASRAAGAARPQRGPRVGSPTLVSILGYNTEDVRAWAKQNGHEISDRGRVPNKIVEAYDAVRKGESPKPARKSPAKKAPAKKATARKTGARKAPAKKSTAKKASEPVTA